MGRRVLSYCVQRRSVQRGGTGLQALLGLVSWQIQYGLPTYVQYLTLLTYICPPLPYPGHVEPEPGRDPETQRPRDPQISAWYGTRPPSSGLFQKRRNEQPYCTKCAAHLHMYARWHASDSRGCRHSGRQLIPGGWAALCALDCSSDLLQPFHILLFLSSAEVPILGR